MLETVLVEAENKAQKERMERLKDLSPVVVPMVDQEMGDNDEDVAMVDTDEIDTRAEDEQYCKIALDYALGHIAASVKEDKPLSASIGKNRKRETSSLFDALLHSAKDTTIDEDTATETPAVEATERRVVDIKMKVVGKKKTIQNKSIQQKTRCQNCQNKSGRSSK